jgi:hypothetical protein
VVAPDATVAPATPENAARATTSARESFFMVGPL